MAAAFMSRGMGSAVGPDRYSMDLTGIIEDYDVSPRLSISAPDLDDGLVSCDEDGVVDGGELGAVAVTVTNPGGADCAMPCCRSAWIPVQRVCILWTVTPCLGLGAIHRPRCGAAHPHLGR